jgi:bacterioferritin (cytochrome b1)
MKEFLELDTKAEVEAIEMYREIIEIANKEKDVTTALYSKRFLKTKKRIMIFLQRCLKRCDCTVSLHDLIRTL